MTKDFTNINSSVLNLISTFNSISKCMGFAVTKSDDTFFIKFVREIVFLWFLFHAISCTVFAELWCIKFLGMGLDVRKVVVFVIAQLVNLSPVSCLLYFRLCDLPVWKITLQVMRLEENLKICNAYLEIGRITFVALFFWGFQFFTIMVMMIYSLWPTLTIFFIFDMVNIFYFEAWVTIPYLQFVAWIWFLCYVSYRLQIKVIEISELEYLTKLDFCRVGSRLDRMIWDGCGVDNVERIKKIIDVMKEVLSIAKDLSTVYGISVLLYVVSYLSRIILHFYDLLNKDTQKIPFWIGIFNVIVRILFVLPLFIFCEHLSDNVNKTVELIQEIVTLHQPSRLDCVLRSFTLRLQHQSTKIQICGFLSITYSSFLAIMTTALAFLLFQLQF